ncbi:methyltransferase domain-containing protein [Desulfurobacterium sp.]|uniref:methyltransferase domain-containing protein n=1 Tax=Desulfurobacterium sp. TaxID=2004706 RepID=UPI002606708C|nr:methyltransferase domain-containing protein [Desulfurobacterium sp.]
MIEINSSKIKKEELLSEVEREMRKLDRLEKSFQPTVDPVNSVDLSELLSYIGGEFIRKAYLLILGREPDPEGFEYYLENLLKGRFSKIDIIVRLRYSREGRERGVKIKGLSKYRVFYSILSSLPGVGSIVGGIKFFVTLPRFVTYVRGIEASSEFQISNLKSLISKLEVNLSSFKNSFGNLAEKQAKELKKIEEELRKNDLKIEEIKKELFCIGSKFQKEEVPTTIEVELQKIDIVERDYYAAFESLFRGSYKDVKWHLKRYLKYIPVELASKFPVLDVGCGRGEFLELLREQRIKAIGVDVDSYQVKDLKKRGYAVYKEDVNSFLEENSKKFSAITAFQVIEHFDTSYLKDFLRLSFEKLVPGGVLILETINPWNYEAFPRFYMDETHVRPIPPDTMSFMLRWFGFSDLKLLFLSPLAEEKFKDEDLKKLYLDYALISKKPVDK